MSIALDIGAGSLRSLRRCDGELAARRCRSVYALVDDAADVRRLLQQMRAPIATCEDGLLLLGEPVTDLARVFQVPTVPLLPEGRLPRRDPPARQALAALIEGLLPWAQFDSQPCVLTVPGAPAGEIGQTPEEAFFTRLVRMRGYRPVVLSASAALTLAGMAGSSFTGVAFVIGAATCEIALSRGSKELCRSVHPYGGNWIDERLARANDEFFWDAAGHRYLDTARVARWKESLNGSLLQPRTRREEQLAELYKGLLDYVLRAAAEEFRKSPAVRRAAGACEMFVCGGPALMPGFCELLQKTLAGVEFPLEISGVRLAADADFTVARGCLIHAELEARQGGAADHAA